MGVRSSFKESEIKKLLRKFGCYFAHWWKGSHEIRFNPENGKTFTIAFHSGKNMKEGTLRSILRTAGINEEKFLGAAGKGR